MARTHFGSTASLCTRPSCLAVTRSSGHAVHDIMLTRRIVSVRSYSQGIPTRGVRMMANSKNPEKDDKGVAEGLGDAASDAASKVRDAVSRAGDAGSRVGDAASDAASKVRDAASQAGDAGSRVGDAASQAGDAALRVGDEVKDKAEYARDVMLGASYALYHKGQEVTENLPASLEEEDAGKREEAAVAGENVKGAAKRAAESVKGVVGEEGDQGGNEGMTSSKLFKEGRM